MALTSAAATTEADVQSQYHHFVPRFILNNFSHPFKHPGTGGRRKRKQIWEAGKFLYEGDKMLNTIVIADSPPSLKEAPVKYSLGVTDMYRNLTKAGKLQHKLEQDLSRLESRAGEIYQKVKKAFDQKQPGIWLTREERDRLRKFLFVMKYRGPTFYNRYNHESIDSYIAEDKNEMRRYMEEHGFTRPLDVWYDNMDIILNLQHDLEGNWRSNLTERIFPHDAIWYINHTEMMYLAIGTPKSAEDEFILTSECFNICEGPQSFGMNLVTGEIELVQWTNYHEFSPVSANLTFIVRSFLLPLPQEDINPEIRERREQMRKMATNLHANPDSFLEDLPVTMARNSYTQVVDGRMQLMPGEDGSRRRDHKFLFNFFQIESNHVDKINSLFFENLQPESTIAYGSKKAMTKTLEWYITFPTDDRHPLKTIPRSQFNSRLSILQKLHEILRELGVRDKRLVWKEMTAPEEYRDRNYRLEKVFQAIYIKNEENSRVFLQGNGPLSERVRKSDFINLYMSLGGTPQMWAYDHDQSFRMKNLRIKIDVWSEGVAEDIRQRIREILENSYMSLPSQRVWLYLVLWSLTRYHHSKELSNWGNPEEVELCLEQADRLDSNCPENRLARSRHLFKSDRSFNIVMFGAHSKFWTREANPSITLNSLSGITLDGAGHNLLQKIKQMTFQPTAVMSICTCGIPEIEEFATTSQETMRSMNLHRLGGSRNPFFTEEENLEMLVRFTVREAWKDTMGNKYGSPSLGEFKALFFSLIYPTYMAE